ncbi:hypothetical protein CHS0354_028720 [Potamilus streckersoni]|uniref:Uncharacterized protein n=1 Tax=Potamilus streckersoni TaxID=2493646 RepID=A0AAE0SZH7_9BIVA|nr:hypothetical protein CHS0354_028720 [Potamilus streckersoni]
MATASEGPRLMVAAIDFGTTFSSWAYSFKNDHGRVFCKNWNSDQHISMKAPTTVLFQPDGETFEAFGYEAENRYANIGEESEEALNSWYYYRRFKMKLYNRKITRDLEIQDEKGHSLPAIKVFTAAIRYLKDDLLNEGRQGIKDGDLKESDVDWVITVPAIWDDPAKQFMREAAIGAGISSERMTISLEPEAASLFCKENPLEKRLSGWVDDVVLGTFQPGEKYIVIDCGGGTVDITVHEVLDSGDLRELHRASGGAWGGTTVDMAFENRILRSIFGEEILRKFRSEFTYDYLSLFRDFEVKKRKIQPSQTSDNFVIALPVTLTELLQEDTGLGLKDAIGHSEYSGQIKTIRGNKLKIESSLMAELFSDSVNNIVRHLNDLLFNSHLSDIKTILMVGGLAESPCVQHNVRKIFPQMNIIVPAEPSLAVLKGAVLFGHRPKSIVERVSRYTYGTSITEIFDPKKHPLEKLYQLEDRQICRDIFDIWVSSGDAIKCGNFSIMDVYYPSHPGDKYINVRIFASTQKTPRFVTDDGCIRLGKANIELNMDVPYHERKVEVEVTFGDTELHLKAREAATGNLTRASFDLIG